MSKKKGKTDLKTALKGLPITFHWTCLQFEDKTTTKSLNTQTQKVLLRNFDNEKLTIEMFYDPVWYKTKIIAHAGKKF